jgi:hypothetical protein
MSPSPFTNTVAMGKNARDATRGYRALVALLLVVAVLIAALIGLGVIAGVWLWRAGGHKTKSMYRRYNIGEADLRAAAETTQLYLGTLPTELRR